MLSPIVRTTSVALCAILIAGCAITQSAPPLASDHPANPAAKESALPEKPTTLRSHQVSRQPAPNEATMDGTHSMDHSRSHSNIASQSDHHAESSTQHAHSGESAAGTPGKADQVTREIRIAALDAMRYDPNHVSVKAGETVRFIVTNAGQVPHEFVIGAAEEQREHAEMMRKMPNMKHEDSNTLTLAPGETKTLLWRFSKDGEVEIACHVPGHYEAGMRGTVLVSGAAPTSQSTVKDEKHDEHKH